MSNYTTELRVIVEQFNELNSPENYLDTDTMIHNCLSQIFSNYPIFDENYRNVLNEKIVKYYYFYEIGFETMGRFLFELNETMNRIMPYYNKLYLAWLNDFNPLYSTNLKTEHKGSSMDNELNESKENSISNSFSTNQNVDENNGTFDSEKNNDSANLETDISKEKNVERFSDTPQGSLANIENNTYLSSATIKDNDRNDDKFSTGSNKSKENSTTNNKTQSTSNDFSTDVNNINRNDNKNRNNFNEYIDIVSGYGNCPSENLQKYCEALLNIDNMIIKDLADCFMMIF